jgi:hypothetical protein
LSAIIYSLEERSPQSSIVPYRSPLSKEYSRSSRPKP